MSRIEYREVYDGLMYVVYDSKGNRRGAFDSEWDAEAFLEVMDDNAVIEPAEGLCHVCSNPEHDDCPLADGCSCCADTMQRMGL